MPIFVLFVVLHNICLIKHSPILKFCDNLFFLAVDWLAGYHGALAEHLVGSASKQVRGDALRLQGTFDGEVGGFHPFYLNRSQCMYHQQQNKWYSQRCLLAHFETALDFSRSKFTCT